MEADALSQIQWNNAEAADTTLDNVSIKAIFAGCSTTSPLYEPFVGSKRVLVFRNKDTEEVHAYVHCSQNY